MNSGAINFNAETLNSQFWHLMARNSCTYEKQSEKTNFFQNDQVSSVLATAVKNALNSSCNASKGSVLFNIFRMVTSSNVVDGNCLKAMMIDLNIACQTCKRKL